MTTSKFGITEDGDVFLLNGGFRKLGHISYLAAARTPIAQEVQQWWHVQLESDGPIENIIEVQEKGNGRCQYRLRAAAEAALAAGGDVDAEPVEMLVG